MKIKNLETCLLKIPLGEPGLYDGGPPPPAKHWFYLLVKIVTDEGIVGIGGQMPKGKIDAINSARYINEVMKPFLIQEIVEPFYIGKLVKEYCTRPPSLTRFPSCIEMALWDAVGKAAGQPVYKLLGATKDKVKAYATVPHEYPDWTANKWVDMAEKVYEDGFRAIKLEISSGKSIADVKNDIEIVRAIKDTVENRMDIMVDAESGWVTNTYSFRTALKLAKGLEKIDVVFLEEPIHHISNPDLSAKLAAAVDIPIAGGGQITYSHHFKTLLEKHSLDIVQPDVENIGGISETRKVALLAEAYGQVCICHSFGPGLLLPATLQVAGSTNIPYVECVYYPPVITKEIRDSILMEPLNLEKDGCLKIPNKPGLGVELNEETVTKYMTKIL